jgi:hypothetical protein
LSSSELLNVAAGSEERIIPFDRADRDGNDLQASRDENRREQTERFSPSRDEDRFAKREIATEHFVFERFQAALLDEISKFNSELNCTTQEDSWKRIAGNSRAEAAQFRVLLDASSTDCFRWSLTFLKARNEP